MTIIIFIVLIRKINVITIKLFKQALLQ